MDTQIIRCGNCKNAVSVPRNMGMKRVTCPYCKYVFLFNGNAAAAYNNPNPYPPRPGGARTAFAGPREKASEKEKRLAVGSGNLCCSAGSLCCRLRVGEYGSLCGQPALQRRRHACAHA